MMPYHAPVLSLEHKCFKKYMIVSKHDVLAVPNCIEIRQTMESGKPNRQLV